MAMAPEQVGIGIRRYFTKPGSDPYDTVEWERRDARIQNFKDGTDAFFQPEVEFPRTWSVNAANIVAQKYFRGTLGTTEREWSLRQVIDRVADTITDWGIRDGHFMDDEEAAAFRAELKYVLVHQRAAFNSPVWFNIGVRDTPQQASACQPYHALVSTPEGLVPIGKLVDEHAIGTKVFDARGITQVVGVKANGHKEVLRVYTRAGITLDVTPDHLVWRIRRGARRDFVAAGTLQPGDQLEWHRAESWGTGEITTEEIAEAALAGWLQADGFVGRYQGTNRSLTIEAMSVTDAERKWVEWAVDTVFPGAHRHERAVATQDESLDCRRLRLYGNHLQEFVDRWDLMTRGVDMTVPAHLFGAPLPIVAAYLRSLFQAEGYVSQHERASVVGLDMISEGIVRGAQQLLMRFGIYSRVRFKADRRANRKGCWSLSIRVAGDRRRFADEIGFFDERKAEKLEATFAVPGHRADAIKHLEIERIESLGEMDVFDIQTESGEYLSNHLRVHNCFILAVEDTMEGILNWYREEGTIFKGGSGSGINLSNIRSSFEGLKGGGTASGPVSFMRGADASAGTIKSAGKTRRAAKMVILNADHPDIEEFIWCKALEERKAHALADAGFDMDLDGKDSHSIQYQNANNSVRVTDDFMRAVLEDKDWDLEAVTTGDPIKSVRARELMRQISEATWECADPGMQFDTTINKWHTAPNTGRINASNPCFTGDALVHTDKGLLRFADLLDRARQGETFGVYTHDATNPDEPLERLEVTRPEAIMVTGFNEIVKLSFSNGMELRCTPGHMIFTVNRGYVEAKNLTDHDRVKVLTLSAPATAADWRLPVSARLYALGGRGDKKSRSFQLPEKWSPELAHYLGWLVGDGCISGDVVSTVYGSDEERDEILPRHRALATEMNDGIQPTPSVQANGTTQLRQSRRVISRLFEALGVSRKKAGEKVVPEAIYEAPSEIAATFLQGLFDADGCVYDGDNSRYVGLGSASRELLVGVQRLLSTFGVFSRIYQQREAGQRSFSYTRKDGTPVDYGSGAFYDLRIANRSIARFAEHIGFGLGSKAAKLVHLLATRRLNATDETVRLHTREDDGVELTYNLTEPRNHSYVVNGTIVRNCSEYMHLDNSACNLASINLLKYLGDDGTFDVAAYKHTIEVMFTAQEILVGNADYPTESIGDTSRRFRQLGLGYANLGALLMAEGLPYDSPAGRAWAASLTALMTGHAYATSARTAGRMGPFAGYADNEEPMLEVLRMHRAEAAKIDEELVPPELLSAAQRSWDDAVELGERYGVRNSQATVLAPTGCLVGGTLVPTERGLVRLRSLGDPDGPQWQDLGLAVLTDDGAQEATQFYVNGLEQVVDVVTERGYRLRGTAKHRIKVVDETGAWVWRRLADVQTGDRVPLALDQLVGEPQEVVLPPLGDAYWTGEHSTRVPRTMTPELAEFVGYFMGDGSLHAKGVRLCVAAEDFEVGEHLVRLGKELFGLEAHRAARQGYTELSFHSVRLAQWWEASGFAKQMPSEGHTGKGYRPHVPEAVLHANRRETYRAFLRGLFEADGTVTGGIPTWTTASLSFADDVQSLLLALGFPTTRKRDVSGRGSQLSVLRLLNTSYHDRWLTDVGFLSARKTAKVGRSEGRQAARKDYVPVTRVMVDRLAPVNDSLRKTLLMEVSRGRVSRRAGTELLARTGDAELAHLLGFFYDAVALAELGDEELTYDLSVPANVTYVANGFVSHNTIGLMMDCDTTGIEPDLALTKAKKLVGGGTMYIVNQTVPRALAKLGYSADQVDAIVGYIDEHKTIIGAPGFNPEHLSVFACSMGDNTIHYMGHVTMMGAVQPFISGAISKCVIGDTLLTTADGLVRIASLHRGEDPDSFRDEVIEVASLDGPQKTDAFYYGGLRAVREVVLRSGHRVVATPNHRLLVAGEHGLDWKATSELEPGDCVAVQYGDNLWASVPARFDDFMASTPDGSPQGARVPAEMTEELAFLLGAYASQGHTTRNTATVAVSSSVDSVLERVAAAWRSELGVEARIERRDGECPRVVVSSASIVAFLDYLGCGSRASEQRIPNAVLRSPRPMVLAYLQGLALDAHVTGVSAPKWTICLDSPRLLDDLQAVLTNLGIVHSRFSKLSKKTGKTYGEVHATGFAAQRLVRDVPFLEPEKALRAEELLARELDAVAEENLQFSPVTSVDDAGLREVFDVSVPSTHAFVGNGIVNHNTVNMPEEATVEDVEHLHVEAWRLGLKAVAIYRDNCKVGQPLSTQKKTAALAEHGGEIVESTPDRIVERIVEHVIVQEPVRQKLPRVRRSKTFSFRVADCHGYATVGEFEDGRPGEVFLKVAKQGSTLAGIMDAFAISISLGLQYGVPLRAFVEKFTNMRFEPAGMTDDPDLRFATSLADYIFRRLAVEYLSEEERRDLGILTVGERLQPTLPGVEEHAAASITEPGLELLPPEDRAPSAPPAPPAIAPPEPRERDTVLCYVCGDIMQRAGSCYACPSCGTTSGCS